MKVRSYIAGLVAGLALLVSFSTFAHEGCGKAEHSAAMASVDLRDSVRQYQTRMVYGWNVNLEGTLMTDRTNLANLVIQRLNTQLGQVSQLLPAHALPFLRKVSIYVVEGDSEAAQATEYGAEYLSKDAPHYRRNLDPDHGHSIVIYSAQHLAEMTDFGVLKLLVHEFAHAWHLLNWTERHYPIMGAWEAAMTRQLYRGVRKSDGSYIVEAYACKNQLEYFAELSCIWFCRNDHFPFERGDLKVYDAGGARLMEELWSKPPTRYRNTPVYSASVR